MRELETAWHKETQRREAIELLARELLRHLLRVYRT